MRFVPLYEAVLELPALVRTAVAMLRARRLTRTTLPELISLLHAIEPELVPVDIDEQRVREVLHREGIPVDDAGVVTLLAAPVDRE